MKTVIKKLMINIKYLLTYLKSAFIIKIEEEPKNRRGDENDAETKNL